MSSLKKHSACCKVKMSLPHGPVKSQRNDNSLAGFWKSAALVSISWRVKVVWSLCGLLKSQWTSSWVVQFSHCMSLIPTRMLGWNRWGRGEVWEKKALLGEMGQSPKITLVVWVGSNFGSKGERMECCRVKRTVVEIRKRRVKGGESERLERTWEKALSSEHAINLMTWHEFLL